MKTISNEFSLTKKELDYFNLLKEHEGEIVKRDSFGEFHDNPTWNSNVIDVHMMNLRKKLVGKYTVTAARGFGFKLELV